MSPDTPDEPRAGAEPPLPTAPDPVARFIELSVVLTGFDRAELAGTGMVAPYYAAFNAIVGERVVGQLLAAWASIAAQAGGDAAQRAALIESQLLNDERLGPLARNLTTLWYTGLWTQLPFAWSNAYGANARDVTHYVSGKAYTEGLVWSAMQTHPQGAKQPGYGSWSLPPKQGGRHV